MSLPTPATQEFLDRWNPLRNQPNLLVRIDLAVPSALSLYLSMDPRCVGDSGVTIGAPPDGRPWQPVVLSTDPVHAPGAMLAAGPTLCTWGLRIRNTRLIPQSSGVASDLFNEYVVKGAKVTGWLWDGSIAFAKALPIFLEGIVQGASITRDQVYLRCIQRKDWRRTVPPEKVSRATHPGATEAALGKPLPLIFGGLANDGFDDPWPEPYPDYDVTYGDPPYGKLTHEAAGAAGLVVPGLLVDTGIGTGDAKVLFAAHPLGQLGNLAGQESVKIAAGSVLANLNEKDIADDILGDNSGFLLKDQENIATVGVPLIDVRTDGSYPNNALNPRAALELWDPSSFAIVSSDGSHDRLALINGNVGTAGEMIDAELVIGYRTSHTSTSGEVSYHRAANPGGGYPSPAALSAHTVAGTQEPVVQRFPLNIRDVSAGAAILAGEVTNDWNIAAGDINVTMAVPQVGHYIHVFFVAIVVIYRPAQSLVTPEQTTTVFRQLYDPTDPRTRIFSHRLFNPLVPFNRQLAPSVYEVQGQFYANVAQGFMDDGSGTRTGIADGVIERPPDIVRTLLEEYGLESPSKIATSIDVFGSFTRARPRSVSIEGNPNLLGVHVGEETTIGELITRIAAQDPAWCYLSRFDDTWRYLPWRRRIDVADFPRKLEADDIFDIEIEDESETDIITGVRVDYAFDHFRNRALHTCSVLPDASDGGFSSRSQRDQLIKIEAGVNNYIDHTGPSGPCIAILDAGTFTPAEAMVMVRAALEVSDAAGTWNVGWGGTIVDLHNARIPFAIGGNAYSAILPEGDWTIPELIYHAQSVMRSTSIADAAADIRVGIGFLVVEGFNDKIYFGDGAGTVKVASIPPGWYRSGADLAVAVAATLNAHSSNWTCSYDGGTKKFTIDRTAGDARLYWLSGPETLITAAALLGFSHASDRFTAPFVGDYARNRGLVHVQSTASMTMKWSSGIGADVSAAVSLGWRRDADDGPGLNIEGDFVIQEETFAIDDIAAFDLYWASGANAHRSAAHVLGFRNGSDDLAQRRHMADRRRGARETGCAEAAEWYGEKEPLTLRAIDIRTTEGAINLRDVHSDLRRQSPLRLKIKTHRFPDLERGRVVECGDLSTLLPLPPRYGSSAWDGKLFVAVEVAQFTGESWHQEIVLEEIRDPLVGATQTSEDGDTGVSEPVPPIAFMWDLLEGRIDSASLNDVHAKRFDPETGTMAWAGDGARITAAGFAVSRPSTIIGQADGTAWVAFLDDNGSSRIGIFVNKIDATGAKVYSDILVSPTGTTNAPTISTTNANNSYVAMCSDGAGGVFVTYTGAFSGGSLITRLQHVTAAGSVSWSAPGVDLTSAGSFIRARLARSGTGVVVSADSTQVKKYSSTGTLLWTSALSNTPVNMTISANGGDWIEPASPPTFVSSRGGVFVLHSSGTQDARISKLDEDDGTTTWTSANILDGTEFKFHAFALCDDGDGGVVVGGMIKGTITGGGRPNRVRVIRVLADGTVAWRCTVQASSNSKDTGWNGGFLPCSLVAHVGGGDIVMAFRETPDTNSSPHTYHDVYVARINGDDGTLAWGPTKVVEAGAATSEWPLHGYADGTRIVFRHGISQHDVMSVLVADGAIEWGPSLIWNNTYNGVTVVPQGTAAA